MLQRGSMTLDLVLSPPHTVIFIKLGFYMCPSILYMTSEELLQRQRFDLSFL